MNLPAISRDHAKDGCSQIMKITNLLQMLTIRERLAAGYGLLILILLVGGGFTLYSLYKINDAQQQIGKSVVTAKDSISAMGHAQESERLALEWAYPVLGEKGALSAYMLAEDDKQRKALFAEFAGYGKRIKQISEEIQASLVSPEAKKQVDEIRTLQDQIQDAAIGVIAAFDGEVEYGPETKKNMGRFSALVENLKDKIKEFQERSDKEVEGFKSITDKAVKTVTTYVESADRGISSSIRSNMLVTLIGIVFAVTIAVLMYRSIIQPLGRASKVAERIANYDLREDADAKDQVAGRDEISKLLSDLSSMRGALAKLMRQVMELVTGVSEACRELTATAQIVEGSSQRQLEYVKDSSTSTSQMSDMAGDLARTATEAASCAEEADEVARRSVEKDAKQTLEIIGTVEKEVEGAHLQIRNLWEAAEKVSTILTVINEIADQTNLLALNAAIEAARAGEQGRGFAVVADEVRALAKRTTESTSKIESTISHIQQETTKALENMGQIKGRVVSGAESVSGIIELLTQIQQLVARLQGISQGVATATEEQSTETANISNNLDELQKESEQLDKEASTISERANGLLETVDQLKSEVSRFVI